MVFSNGGRHLIHPELPYDISTELTLICAIFSNRLTIEFLISSLLLPLEKRIDIISPGQLYQCVELTERGDTDFSDADISKRPAVRHFPIPSLAFISAPEVIVNRLDTFSLGCGYQS